MKYSEGNKPLSHRIHTLMYKKMAELNELKMRRATPFGLIDSKKKEIQKLEQKFIKQIAWENSCDN